MKKRASARVRVSTRDRRRSGGQTRSGSIGLTPLFQKAYIVNDVAAGPEFCGKAYIFFQASPTEAAMTKSGTTHFGKCSNRGVRATEVTGDNNLANEAFGESFRQVISNQLKHILIR